MRNEYGQYNRTDPNCPWCHDRRCEVLTWEKDWPCEHAECICPIRDDNEKIRSNYLTKEMLEKIKNSLINQALTRDYQRSKKEKE